MTTRELTPEEAAKFPPIKLENGATLVPYVQDGWVAYRLVKMKQE